MNLTKATEVEIGGLRYQIALLPVAKARAILPIVQQAIASLDESIVAKHGALLLAGLAGTLPADALERLVDTFAPLSLVHIPEEGKPDRVCKLDAKGIQDEVFAGALELQLAWVEACIEANFKGLLEKTRGVAREVQAQMRAELETPKAAPKG